MMYYNTQRLQAGRRRRSGKKSRVLCFSDSE